MRVGSAIAVLPRAVLVHGAIGEDKTAIA